MTDSTYAGTALCNPINGTLPLPNASQVHLPPGSSYCGFEYPVLLSDISSACCANNSQVQIMDGCYQYCAVANDNATHFGDCVVKPSGAQREVRLGFWHCCGSGYWTGSTEWNDSMVCGGSRPGCGCVDGVIVHDHLVVCLCVHIC